MAQVMSFTVSPSKATLISPATTRSSPQTNLVFTIPSTAIHPKLSTLKFCSHPKTPNPLRTRTVAAAGFQSIPTPATDRVIDFGKYKGKMLGTLPSSYLRWMSRELRAVETLKWAWLADQVLADPVYRERIEWEVAENVLSGNSRNSRRDGSSAADELFEIGERFGWDFEDKVGWSKVRLGLLGTSKGGRIPRLRSGEMKEGKTERLSGDGGGRGTEMREGKMTKAERLSGDGGGRRGERRERVRRRLRAEKITSGAVVEKEEEIVKDDDGDEAEIVRVKNRFPGRQALLNKVLNRKKFL